MLSVTRPTPSHFGIYATDPDLLVNFYTRVFGLTQTDRGQGKTFPVDLIFLSASPDQHHQLVIAGGRPKEATFSTVMQISFVVPSIQSMREIRQSALAAGATKMRGLNHGNALSIYFSDPEGNTVEVYIDTPYYVAQPHGDPLDLEKSDEELMRETEAICRADPTFMPIDEWQARFAQPAPRA
ncbi:MAG: VOC family protein [Hydrogenophaga sp.]|nr:VOC family protein [Hydrogenophaga sp.]